MKLRFLLACFVCCFATPAPAQFGESYVLQPRTYASPDRHWTLSVDPTQPSGGGPGRYECRHDGQVVWSGERPWAFADALITNDGIAAGYAYPEGGESALKGTFHAIVLGPDGATRLDRSQKRESSQFLHTPSNPLGNGVFHHAELGRVAFRVHDDDVNRRREEWWIVPLPDAKELERLRPRDRLPEDDPSDVVVALAAVPGTPLTLFEWRTFDWPRIGLQFTLQDAALAPVWSLKFPGELRRGSDDKDDEDVSRKLYREGSVFPEAEPGHFAVGLPRLAQKIHFVAETIDGAWKVRELSREAWTFGSDEVKTNASFADMPVTVLEPRGEFPIDVRSSSATAVRDVLRFECAKDGVVRFVRAETDGAFTLMRVDVAGKVLLERRVVIPDLAKDVRPQFWSLGPTMWLATQSPYGNGARARAWRLDESGGEVTRLERFTCPSVDDVAALGGGRFVVLGTERGEYTQTDVLQSCEADGNETWSARGDLNSDDPGALFSPEAIAVTTDGSIAVLDVIRHTIQLYQADGKHQRTIDVDKVLGRKANYPSGLRADVDGGLFLEDFGGSPPLAHLTKEGTVRATLAPRFPDGRVAPELSRNAMVDAKGTCWTTDGQRILRVGADGVVDVQIGAKPDANVLAEPSAVAVDVFGRVLIQDAATLAVHVFDASGKKLFVCRPDPKDFERVDSIAHLAATRERGVVIERAWHSFVRFGPSGQREGIVNAPDYDDLVYSPKDGAAFGCRFRGGFARLAADTASGELKPVVTFDRLPTGAWLTGVVGPAVSNDGTVTVSTRDGSDAAKATSGLVFYETGKPDAGRWVPLPVGASGYNLSTCDTWAVVCDYTGVGCLVRRKDGRCVKFDVTRDAEKHEEWRYGFDADGKELVVVGGKPTVIRRFALP